MHASKYQVSNLPVPAVITARLQERSIVDDNSVAHLLKALHILTPEPCMATRFLRPCDVIPAQTESPGSIVLTACYHARMCFACLFLLCASVV